MRGTCAWTDADVHHLKTRWEIGATAAEIASEMGRTRSSVLSKVHREGLKREIPVQRRVARRWSKITRDIVLGATPPPMRVESPPPRVRWINIDDMPPPRTPSPFTTCQYPIGDPRADDFRLCGAPTFNQTSYCREHASWCFRGGEE